MKTALTRILRRLLPTGATKQLEEIYRRMRIAVVASWYGSPAKKLRVVAITGTNGKTTTASYLNEILKQAGFTTGMFSTAVIELAGKRRINDLNATVASTAAMQRFFRDAYQKKVDIVILEVTSHSLDQHKLDGVPIEVAIMTNLTQDHLDYHKTMENYAAAKGKLFARRPRYSILNSDDTWFDFFAKYQPTERLVTYGTTQDADVRFSLDEKNFSQAVTFTFDDIKLTAPLYLPGEYNAANFAAAATAAVLLGADQKAIYSGADMLRGVPGRFEYVPIEAPFEVVVDYAHTPDALEKLLTAAKNITKNQVILVFGATGDRDKGKRPIMGAIAARLADRIILTDEESYNEDPAAIRQQVRAGVEDTDAQEKLIEIADRKEAIVRALKEARPGDTILITGMGHEQYRIVNGERLPWNDATVVRELSTTQNADASDASARQPADQASATNDSE